MPSDSLSLPRLALAVALLGSVAAVGIVGFWPGGADNETAPPIGHNASEQLASLDSLTATVETTLDRGNNTTQTTQFVKMRPGTGKRWARTVNSSSGNLTSDLLVSNGSFSWLYDRESNNVTVIETAGGNTQMGIFGERIERLFTRLNISRDAMDERKAAPPTPGVAPLPRVPSNTGASGSTTSPQTQQKSAFGVTYNGTETVSGRETYVLQVQSPDNASGTLANYSQTMYVDTEWFFPVRRHTEFTLDGERVETTTTYRNITFNPDLDDSTFQFDPPANTTVDRIDSPDIERYDSLAALRANASLSVPDPDVPDSLAFDTAREISGRYRAVTLQYSNETVQLGVSKSNLTADAANTTNATNISSGEPLTVNGQNGTYQVLGTTRAVSWECGGFRYTVSGSGVSRSLVVEVAESVECG